MHEAHNSSTGSGQVVYLDAPVKLLPGRVLRGCNAYHESTVIRQPVSLGSLSGMTSVEAGSQFALAFMRRFRNLQSFVPRNGLNDDLFARLTTAPGMGFGELLLEAILAVEYALAFTMNELDAIDYAVLEEHPDHCELIWACKVPRLSRGAAEVALAGLLELLPRTLFARPPNSRSEFDRLYRELTEVATRRRLSPTTAVLRQAAVRRGLPCEVLGRQHLRLGHGKAQHQLYASLTGTTSVSAQKTCADRRLTNRRLTELRLPVPKQLKVDSVEAARAAAESIGYPVVVKPVKRRKDNASCARVDSPETLDGAFRAVHREGADVLIERCMHGNEYRLLVVGGRFIAALTCEPPRISGDGVCTVDQLIDQLNAHPWRDGFRLFPVERDTELAHQLSLLQLTGADVLADGRSIALRATGEVSAGGVPVDVTDEVHGDIRDMAERAATGVGLDIAGIEFITFDVTRSFRDLGGAIIGLNARPELCTHTWPMKGRSRNVAGEVLNLSVPADTDGRIPIVTVAGDKGTGTTARCIDMILRGAGSSVALALREQSFVNGESAELTPAQQVRALRILLGDPQVDTLVSTVSPRRAARNGLSLDRCSVTVIHDRARAENATLFHQGVDIVARATSDCFVVAAGNRLALDLIKDVGARRLILVSERHNDPDLRAHLEQGEVAVTTMWQQGRVRIVLLAGDRILAAFGSDASASSRVGRIGKQRLKKGTMFAIAAAYGTGMSGPEIAAALEQAPPIVADEH